jgi:alpha-ketoglutarate-dependent taurine dioxygenase
MTQRTLTTKRLGGSVGAEVLDVDPRRLQGDDGLPQAILAELEDVGVLVFRGLRIDPEVQVSFCRKLGSIETQLSKSHPVEGISRITLDRSKTATADYFLGNFGWHIDGCTPHGDEAPPMVTMLSAQVVAEGGDTEFASTYAAYEGLSEQEKTALAPLRVLHRFESAVLPFLDHPTPEHRARLRAQPTKIHPLVWTHESGRRSLVIGTHADHVEGMPLEDGRALLADLLERATRPDLVYRHRWVAGDTVLWDNRGLLHRVARYDTTMPREMFRTTVLGQEAIR